jgi:hypothetical protein
LVRFESLGLDPVLDLDVCPNKDPVLDLYESISGYGSSSEYRSDSKYGSEYGSVLNIDPVPDMVPDMAPVLNLIQFWIQILGYQNRHTSNNFC